MDTETTMMGGSWAQGALWVFFAYVYALYFGHVKSRLKPDLRFVNVPGSPERLEAKKVWCHRFMILMSMPTILEAIKPSLFTSAFISLSSCFFGVFVMYAVYREVMRSEMPKSSQIEERKGL